MATQYSLNDLEIIGFADTLNDSMVPTTVTPVFKLTDGPGTVLFPPFSIVDAQVVGAAVSDQQEFDDLLKSGRVTPITTSFSAQPDFLLWIDIDHTPHYESISDATLKLDGLAHRHATAASLALAKGDSALAETHSRRAVSAGCKTATPYAVMAAIAEKKGNSYRHDTWQDRFRQLGGNMDEFNALVTIYCYDSAHEQAVEETACLSMSGVALLKPSSQAA